MRPEATAGPISRNFSPEKVSAVIPPFFSSFGSSFFSSFFGSFFALFAGGGFLPVSLSWAASGIENTRDNTRRKMEDGFIEAPFNSSNLICHPDGGAPPKDLSKTDMYTGIRRQKEALSADSFSSRQRSPRSKRFLGKTQ